MKIDERINSNYEKLNETERYICQYFYEHKKKFYTQSIDEIAKDCGVSKSMLVRFAKHLGLSGFKELKAMIRLEDSEKESITGTLMQDMTDSYHKMLSDFLKRDYTRIFETIHEAKRMIVYGSGSSQARVASEMKRIFLPEKLFVNLHGHDMCHAIEKNVKVGDVVFMISLSGEAEYMIQLAKKLQIQGVFTVSITRMSNNELAANCAENLYIESVHMNVGKYGDYESTTPYFIQCVVKPLALAMGI